TGTSLAGQTCNAAMVFDFSKYLNRILSIDPAHRSAQIQPGVVLDTLRADAGRHGLTFGPDPSTHEYCTLGGMIGNNSCGVRSVMARHYTGATVARPRRPRRRERSRHADRGAGTRLRERVPRRTDEPVASLRTGASSESPDVHLRRVA